MRRLHRPIGFAIPCLLGLAVAVACGSNDDGSPDNDGGGAPGDSGADSDGTDNGTDDGANGTGGLPGTSCANASPHLAVTRLDALGIAAMGKPFDTTSDDRSGPNSWGARYGKTPEIVPHVQGEELAVAFQDQEDGEHLYVVRVGVHGEEYAVTSAFEVDSLGRLMGFTRDDDGHYYVATGVDEDEQVDATYPPNDIHRPDIVRVVKFDENGCVLMESDVDMERGAKDAGSEIIVNPMTAASSRLVWGADRLVLVHGHNTKPDPNIGGTRHQKAITTHLDANTGAATRTSSMWVSHSFDQRALFDGTGFVEFHLGDAYPRTLALGRYGDDEAEGAYAVLRIKGDVGANETHTRLGSIVRTEDATHGYMALFATEDDDVTTEVVNTPRNLAIARIRADFATLDTDSSVVDEGAGTTVLSSTQHWTAGTPPTPQQATYENHLRWLTDFPANTHAERPRLANLGGGTFVVLYEQWTTNGTNANNDAYVGTYGLVVDDSGAVTKPAAAISGAPPIDRGDDIVSLGGRALYVTGDGTSLWLNFVDDQLAGERFELP
ncbi:MAG TPA: hypothetical protein VLC09_14955 [Polyangiaceae bacterium]|nr:hypothetical protein [Polyangiaceae bacterium]